MKHRRERWNRQGLQMKNNCCEGFGMMQMIAFLLCFALTILVLPIGAVNAAKAEVGPYDAIIADAYSRALTHTGRSSFYGMCGLYVRALLEVMNIGHVPGGALGNGNQVYGNLTANATTSYGYKQIKYPGNNCLYDIVNAYGNNATNIVVSWSYESGHSYSNPGAGHVVFINGIIDNYVYYSESYTSGGIGEGAPRKKALGDFMSAYNRSYGNAIGAVIFTKNTSAIPANLGDDFYAVILNYDCWKPISQVSDSDKIYLESEKGSSKQIWRFQRQENGTYVISSCYDGNILEMSFGTREIYTQITAPHNVFWGGAYQQWYLYPYGKGYIIQSLHYMDEEWVMDLHGANSADGTVIQINNRNNSPAQIWAIYKGDDVQIKGPVLEVEIGDSSSATKFSWSRSYGASYYNVRIFKDEMYSEEDYTQWAINEQTCEAVLPAGRYVAYVDAVNYHTYKGSEDDVWFTVPEALFTVEPDFILPMALKQIGEEAFAGITPQYIWLSDEVTKIGKKAFANCKKLEYIRIPASVTSIAEDAFNGVKDDLTVYAPRGSVAETFAKEHGLKFVADTQ